MYNFFTVTILRFVPIYFVISCLVAAYFYPGGNLLDPQQVGYSFNHNFLSDLGGYTSRSGEINFLSQFFFNLSMFLFVAVGIGFLFVPMLLLKTMYLWGTTFRLSMTGTRLLKMQHLEIGNQRVFGYVKEPASEPEP